MAVRLVRVFSRNYTSVSIREGGKKLQILPSPSASGAEYHALWLRHNCQCSACLSSSNQKTVTAQHLKGGLTLNHAKIKDGQVLIQWNSRDGERSHNGTISLEWLKENVYSDHSLKQRSSEMKPLIGTKLPFVNYNSVMESDEGLWKWLYHLNMVGYCVVSGLPTTVDTIDNVCKRIGNLQRTLYGKTFHVKSEASPINIAYTPVHLDLHMDLAYYQSPPGLQALHCLRLDDCVIGGESTLLDVLPVVEKLRSEFPEDFKTLTEIPATFQKIHFDREYPVVMVYRRPHIVTDRYGKVTKVNWSPNFEGPLSIPEEDIDRYYKAYITLDDLFTFSEHKITYRLKEGEMLVFNNQRILHGRHGFKLNGGVRHLQGCYVNIDEFASRFSVLSRQLNKAVTTKHVLNESSYLSP